MDYFVLVRSDDAWPYQSKRMKRRKVFVPFFILYNEKITSSGIEYSVTAIVDRAFFNCNISSIDIPNSIISIGQNAFQSSGNLTSIVIPNSVTSIESSAFRY